MLKQLVSGLDQVYSTAGPILTATREIAAATSPSAIVETLRKHILNPEIDKVALIQVGFGPSGEAVTQSSLDLPFPDTLRARVGNKPLIVRNISAVDSEMVDLYGFMDAVRATSLAIFPLIAHDRTAGYLLLTSREVYSYTDRESATLELLAAEIAVVLSNLTLLNAISRKTESLDLVNEIAHDLAGSLDIDILGEVLAQILPRAFTISHLSLTLPVIGDTTAEIRTFSGSSLPDEIELVGTAFQQAMDNRQLIQTHDPSTLPAGHLWNETGIKHLVIVPLQGKERKLGTLNIGLDASRDGLASAVEILSQVGRQVTSALENIRLVERLQVTLDETAALYSTSLALNAAQSLEEAYETALSEMVQLSDADRIVLHLAGPDPRGAVKYLEVVAIWLDNELQQQGIGQRYPIGTAPVLSQFPQSRANLMFNDLQNDHRLDESLRAELAARGVNALMMIPLSTGTTWLGALLLEATSGQQFSSDQARLCRNISDQAALVVDGQLLLKRAQDAADREHALRDTAAALSSTLEPDLLLGILLDNLKRVISYDAANILMVEEGSAKPVIIRGYEERGLNIESLMKLSIPIGVAENLRRMTDERKPIVVADTHNYADWVHTDETDWVRSYMGAPIFVGDQLLGFFSLDSEIPSFYTDSHAVLLQSFADQAGVAIQNAQRYQESRARAQREELVGDIAARLQRAHTVEDVMETAARMLQEALGDYNVSLRLTDVEQPLAPTEAEAGD